MRCRLLSLVVVALALSGCSIHAGSSSVADSADSPVPPSVATGSTPSPLPTPSVGPAASTGSDVIVGAAVLPNAARTPGATNPEVTQATIGTTICVSGWTTTVRPPSSETTALKREQLSTGYAYDGDMSTSDYEEDHLISLEIGGSPDSPANLWPEPYAGTGGARVKDGIENKLHTLVCDGAMPLATAQNLIATNWWTAYETYVLGSAPAPAPAAAAVPPAPAAPVAPAPAPSDGATALCRDGTYSYAVHHQGACSSHGGVAGFYN